MMNKTMMTCALALFGAGTFATGQQAAPVNKTTPLAVTAKAGKKDDRAVIQLAILLDTSSSMDGLINQARTYLWKIVNEMTLARQNGKLPHIQIALYEYGNDRLPSVSTWIRQVTPFTDDLDKVSDELFKLKTYGGTECCGAVIARSVKDLAWNLEDKDALKMIFIAGNEPFNQGEVPYASAIAGGLKNGITVNTILCGSGYDQEGWKDGAKKGDGSFIMIDHNATPPDPETPFDKEMTDLGASLNGTYLAYGSLSKQEKVAGLQMAQDVNAKKMAPAAAIGRVQTKANTLAYNNASWDLLDRMEKDGVAVVAELKASGDLPRELQGKSDKEIEDVLKAKVVERGKLQTKINGLSKQRDEWIAKWKKENAAKGVKQNTLDDAIIQAVRGQAGKRNFSFAEQGGK